MERITKEELLEMLFHDDYEHLKGKKLRMTRVRVQMCIRDRFWHMFIIWTLQSIPLTTRLEHLSLLQLLLVL